MGGDEVLCADGELLNWLNVYVYTCYCSALRSVFTFRVMVPVYIPLTFGPIFEPYRTIYEPSNRAPCYSFVTIFGHCSMQTISVSSLAK